MKEPRCPVTGRDDMIDDCHITIEFGYGSDKDLMTYTFSPVHDEVGKKVLALIQLLMSEGKSVEDFGKNEMDEYFGGKTKDWSGKWGVEAGCLTWEEWDALSDEEKANKKKEWGLN
jgi:hypothetical protein